ncbi:transposase [Falsigemmobacter intermedius]
MHNFSRSSKIWPSPCGSDLRAGRIRKRSGGSFSRTAGGQEWVLWSTLVAAGVEAVQLPPAQIKAFALSRGTRAKTDRIDAELIARFMLFRPEVGRKLPGENLRVLRALTTRRAQVVEMRKRLSAQIAARRKQDIRADLEDMDANLLAMLDAQVGELEQSSSSACCMRCRLFELSARRGRDNTSTKRPLR